MLLLVVILLIVILIVVFLLLTLVSIAHDPLDLDLSGLHPFSLVFATIGDPLGCGCHVDCRLPSPFFNCNY